MGRARRLSHACSGDGDGDDMDMRWIIIQIGFAQQQEEQQHRVSNHVVACWLISDLEEEFLVGHLTPVLQIPALLFVSFLFPFKFSQIHAWENGASSVLFCFFFNQFQR